MLVLSLDSTLVLVVNGDIHLPIVLIKSTASNWVTTHSMGSVRMPERQLLSARLEYLYIFKSTLQWRGKTLWKGALMHCLAYIEAKFLAIEYQVFMPLVTTMGIQQRFHWWNTMQVLGFKPTTFRSILSSYSHYSLLCLYGHVLAFITIYFKALGAAYLTIVAKFESYEWLRTHVIPTILKKNPFMFTFWLNCCVNFILYLFLISFLVIDLGSELVFYVARWKISLRIC